MTPEKIQYLLRLRGLSYAELGRQHGVSGSYLSMVASRERINPRMQKIIADAIRRSVEEVFPSSSSSDGGKTADGHAE